MRASSLAILAVLALLAQFASPCLAAERVNVGIYQNEPKLYLDEQGRASGFFPELLGYIAREEGWDLKYVPCVWNECLEKVESGALDLMMDVAFSESRAKRFAFNQEVVLGNWSRVYAREGVAISSILDLDRKKVAVVKGSIQARKLAADAKSYNILPSFIEVENYGRVFDLVQSGDADAGVVNRLYGMQRMKGHGLRETGVVLYPSRLMFAAPKGKGGRLLGRIDNRLKELKKNPNSVYHAALNTLLASKGDSSSKALLLTAGEIAWLAAHQEITIAINRAWPPMDYVDEGGKPQGIGVGFVKALNTRLGGRLKVVPLPWVEMYEGVKDKQIDALMDITPRPDREALFNFTEPYVTVPHIIIAPKDAPYYRDIKALEGKTVAVERGFFIVRILRTKFPGIEVKEFDSTSDALDAVSKGEADAYIGNRAVAMYIIEQELIANLKEHGKIEETSSVNAIGVRKDQPVLRDILQKALDSLDRNEVRAILKTWVDPGGEKAPSRIDLSPGEKEWIAAHPVLRLGYNVDWPPVEYLDDDGQYVGMSADFMKLLGDIIGITIKPVDPQSWRATMEGIKKGSIDLVAAISRTPQREEFLLFSKPYLNFPMVIVTGQVVPYVGDMAALKGKTVAVVNGYASHDLLASHYPGIDLLPVEDISAGLKAVVRQDAYGFVGSLAAISHVLGHEGITGLKVSGETPYNYALAVGVGRDRPVLAGIMDKAVSAMTEEDLNTIYQRWISVTYERKKDYGLLLKVLFGAVLIFAAILYWNRRLAREVGLRQKAEGELIVAKEVAESANLVKSAFLASMSHELRTPLNSIIGFTGIVLNELPGPLNTEQKKQLKMVKGSARHLLNLINDVLDISKIEAGEVEVAHEEFNFRDTVSQVAETLMPFVNKKGLQLSVDIGPDVDTIVSDERRIRQILLNLVNNAIKFTEKGSVGVTCRRQGPRMEVRVTDSGIGIRKKDINGLFKPFRQIDSGLSRRYEGTGLGLSICKRFSKILGGDIQVESRYGKGSTFTFTLPLKPEKHDGEKESPGN